MRQAVRIMLLALAKLIGAFRVSLADNMPRIADAAGSRERESEASLLMRPVHFSKR
jgi:hypothetical protein